MTPEAAFAGLLIWSPLPAKDPITEGFPIGNGRMGALVCGDSSKERLVLCENTLFAGGPYDPDNPEALNSLPKIRELIFQGKNKEAAELAQEKFMSKPIVQMPSQTLGNLGLEFAGHEAPQDYRRELNLDEAAVRVSYKVGKTLYARECFVSHPARVLVLSLSAEGPGTLDFLIKLDSPHAEYRVRADSSGLVMAGKNGDAAGIKGVLNWEAALRVKVQGGSLIPEGNQLRIKGAKKALILVAASTSYKTWKDQSGDPAALNQGFLDAAQGRGLDDLREEHREDFRKLFRRFSLDLGTTPSPVRELPTAERLVLAAKGGEDSSLAALYAQFARYLLISCSRPGGQAATLQGLWVDNLWPPWGGKYTININTEMNYWFAEPANLPECLEPLADMIHDLSESAQRTAKALYGARGWVAHHNTDLWRASGPIDGARWGLWPTGGAWLCTHLWERYLYGGDKKQLSADYPSLKGAAEFFLDALVKDPHTGYLVTCPSTSPENAVPNQGDTALCAGPSMDMSILRDLFRQTAEAAKILGKDEDFRKKVLDARVRLAPLKIGKAGQLQEWQEDWDLEAPERGHRHVSHLYALHPSSQISVLETPDLAAAARKTLELRGDDGTGWSLAWKVNFWARLHEGERAHHLLRMLLSPGKTYPNMFDAHPPFQIDGNFGGTAGILEMLVQSHAQDDQGRFILDLLPALPKSWPKGSVRGLRARGGVWIDMEWAEGALDKATLVSSRGGPCPVRIAGRTGLHNLKAGVPFVLRAPKD